VAPFGIKVTTPLADVTADYESRPSTWNEWQPESVRAFS
jgi:hypothetical protein